MGFVLPSYSLLFTPPPPPHLPFHYDCCCCTTYHIFTHYRKLYFTSLLPTYCILALALHLCLFNVSSLQKRSEFNGKNPIDVAKTEVSRDLVTLYLSLSLSIHSFITSTIYLLLFLPICLFVYFAVTGNQEPTTKRP